MADKEVRIFIKIDGVEKEVKSVQELEGAMKDLQTETKGAVKEGLGMRAVEEVVSRLPGPIQDAARATLTWTRNLKGLKAAIAGTGVGLLVIALGSLVAFLAETRAGFEFLNKVMATTKAVVGQVVKAFSELAQGNIKAAFDALGKGLSDAIKAQVSIAQNSEALRQLNNQLLVQNAQLNKEAELQQKIAENTNLTLTERQEALQKAGAAQLQLAKNTATLAQAEEKLIKDQIAAAATEAQRIQLQDELAQAQASRIDAETQLETKRIEVAKIGQELDKERTEVLLELGKQLEEQQLNLIGSELNRQLVSLENEKKAALKKAELYEVSAEGILQIEETFQASRIKLEEDANREIQRILEVSLKEINQTQLQADRDAAQQRKEERDAELKNLLADTAAFLESERILLEDLNKIEGERQRTIIDGINQLTLDLIENQTERAIIELNFQEDQQIKELESLEATEEEKLKVRDIYNQKRLKLEKESADAEKKLRQQALLSGLDIASQVFGAISNFAAEGSALSKASAVAEATVNTIAGVVRAFKDYPFPASAIIGGIVGAVGAANIAKIIATPLPGNKSVGGTVTRPDIPSATQIDPTAQLRNLQNQLAEQQDFGIQQRGSQAQLVRAYVVSEEVDDAQAMDRRIKNLARL